jgi:hypothetical protein
MRKLAETPALVQLRRTKQHFAAYINQHYAAKAKDCRTCQTVCCADDHFVNVNITRLEAVAIWRTLQNSPRISQALRAQLLQRAVATVVKYRLSSEGDTFQQTYSCPLFEPGIGCVVHWKAKPAPCIQHGCYEDWQDLPDNTQFQRVERRVERLNTQVYSHQAVEYAPLPVWLVRIAEELGNENELDNCFGLDNDGLHNQDELHNNIAPNKATTERANIDAELIQSNIASEAITIAPKTIKLAPLTTVPTKLAAILAAEIADYILDSQDISEKGG